MAWGSNYQSCAIGDETRCFSGVSVPSCNIIPEASENRRGIVEVVAAQASTEAGRADYISAFRAWTNAVESALVVPWSAWTDDAKR